MILSLHGLDFDEAILCLEANGYTRIAEGDWAYVYATPDPARIVRITPYDPAYLHFVHTCWIFPHQHLPVPRSLMRLAGPGYAVEMPRYVPGDLALRTNFLDALKEAMVTEESSHALVSLAQILKRGIAAGEILIPYFAGMDWNPENVMFDGRTPKVVDGFAQVGSTISDSLTNDLPIQLNQAEIKSFLEIPYYRRGQKQYGE